MSDNEKAIIQKRKFLRGVDDQSLKKSWVPCKYDVQTGSKEGGTPKYEKENQVTETRERH